MNFNQQKCALIEALLPLCPFVAVDATQPGVIVPGGLNRSDLVLRLGRDPRVMGMPDLVLDENGFSATIVTQGARFHVTVPWEACSRFWIAEPYTGPIVVWPEAAQAPKSTPPARPPTLRMVKSPPRD